MARLLDGVDDAITLALGTIGDAAWDAMTVAAIVRKSADPTTQSWITQLGASVSRPGFFITTTGTGSLIGFRYNGTELVQTLALTAADGWALVAAARGAGTVAARFAKYVYATDTFTVEDDANTKAADTTAPGTEVRIGHRDSTRFWPGDIAIVAAWRGTKLTDEQIKSLAFGLPAWFAVQPTVLWLLDQSDVAQNVVDITGGGANQTALTGTTVSTAAVPVFGYGHPPILVQRVYAAAGMTGTFAMTVPVAA